MKNVNIKKLLILNIPYILLGLFATNLGEAWRLAEGADMSAKLLGFFDTFMVALSNPLPSFHPLDLVVGIICGAGLRLAVYLKGKNAKKYRHNEEYIASSPLTLTRTYSSVTVSTVPTNDGSCPMT